MTPSRAGTRPSDGAEVLEVSVPVATMWTSPTAPRDVDAPALLATPDVAAWTASMDATVRKGLYGRTLTQLLLGEPARVLERAGDWVRVAALSQSSSAHPDGYPGWVRRDHLADPVARTIDRRAIVATPTAVCVLAGGQPAEVSFGTALRVDSVDEQSATVLLPGDRRGTIRLDRLRLSDTVNQPGHDAGDLLGAAARFLGLRYLWGGTSAWGLDCSGLVHLVFRAFGMTLPRDAFDLAAYVDPVALDEVRPGDLYFFARPGERIYHVGFVSRPVGRDGARWMLHAPEGGELVEDAPLAPHRVETLVSAGRVREPGTGQASPSDV